jgi:hypothetical protein
MEIISEQSAKNIGVEGTVAEVPANNFYRRDDAIVVLKDAGFDVREEYKTPDAPTPRHRTGELMMSDWHMSPVFVITRRDGGMFSLADAKDALHGVDIAGQLHVTFL